MVTLQKSGDSAVKFVFENSQHYLYGNGEIVVPVNSLLLVEDSSDMVTFKKIDGDIFVSARYEEFGMSKAELESWYKDNMVGETGGGGGVDSGTVQTMIDESISGKADTTAVTEAISEAVSGKADTTAVTASINAAVSGKVDTSVYTAYTAATDARFAEDELASGEAFNDLNNRVNELSGNAISSGEVQTLINESVSGKQDTLVSGTNIKTINNESLLGSGNIDIQGGVSESAFTAYTAATDARIGEDEEVTAAGINAINDAFTAYTASTDAVLSGKADTTAVTQSIAEATSGKADTTAVTASINAAVSGKQDTLISGTSIKTINNGSILGSGNIDLVTQSEFKTLSNDVYIISYGNSSTYSSAFVGSKTAYGFTVDLTSYSAAYQKWPFRVYDTVNPNFYNIQISAFGQFFDGSGNQINMPSYLDPNLTKCVNKIFSVYFNTNAYYADYFPNTGNRTFTIYESFIKTSVKDALSGKADTTAVTASINAAVSGKVDTSVYTAYTAATDARIAEDEEVTAAGINALNDKFDGLKLKKVTQAQYDALVQGGTVDANTLYIITNVVS